ncbi:MAG: Fur family transcriptional regulator, partial [Pseudomonadota bacterium]
MRNTQARQAIIEFLSGRNKPTTAREIVEAVAKQRPEINKSTVYRFIKTLTESGKLATIPVPGKGAVYE